MFDNPLSWHSLLGGTVVTVAMAMLAPKPTCAASCNSLAIRPTGIIAIDEPRLELLHNL